MDVLLVAPSFTDPRYPLYLPSENLGIGYLCAVLRANGFAVDILDANMQERRGEHALDGAPRESYELVGISVPFQTVVDESLRIAAAAKDRWPACHLTLGGHFPTFRHVEILKASPSVDSVVRGDGEDTLLELAKTLERGRAPYFVRGLTFRSGDGKVITNAERPPRDDLDTLPYPARDTLRHIADLGHPWPTQVCSSRGCYASCSFCDIRQFYGRTWRARRPSSLIDEIEWLQKTFGSTTFRFTDDEFIGPRPGRGLHGPTRARDIAAEILSRGLSVRLMIDARPEAVELNLFRILREAGTVDCLVGIESGVDRILRLYSKGATVTHNRRAIDVLRALGIELDLGFIMFDPRMTFAELRQNFQFLVDANVVTVHGLRSWLWPLFGTPVVQQLREAGLVSKETLGDVQYHFQDPRVGRAFDVVSRCTRVTYPLDYALFRARKSGSFSAATVAALEHRRLSLWLDIFATVLDEADPFDYGAVTHRADSITEEIVRACATSAAHP